MRSSRWPQSSSKAFTQSCTVFSFSASRLYTRCLPCLITATTPTLRSAPRCFETAGCGSPSATTSVPTARAPHRASNSTICRRRGSAMALNTSAVVGARACFYYIPIWEYVKPKLVGGDWRCALPYRGHLQIRNTKFKIPNPTGLRVRRGGRENRASLQDATCAFFLLPSRRNAHGCCQESPEFRA